MNNLSIANIWFIYLWGSLENFTGDMGCRLSKIYEAFFLTILWHVVVPKGRKSPSFLFLNILEQIFKNSGVWSWCWKEPIVLEIPFSSPKAFSFFKLEEPLIWIKLLSVICALFMFSWNLRTSHCKVLTYSILQSNSVEFLRKTEAEKVSDNRTREGTCSIFCSCSNWRNKSKLH